MTVECDILFHARLHWVCVCRHYTKAAESRFHIFTLTLSLREREQPAAGWIVRGVRRPDIALGFAERQRRILPLPWMLVSHIFLARHRCREMHLKAWLMNRVVCLVEQATATFLCPGGTS